MIITGSVAIEKDRTIFMNGSEQELRTLMATIQDGIPQPYIALSGLLYIDDIGTLGKMEGVDEFTD